MAESNVYSSYAGVYDLWMEPEMYDGWEELILGILQEHGMDPSASGPDDQDPGSLSLCDIACGTGQMSVRFAADGFAVTGIDFSEEMLAEAAARAERLGIPTDFAQMDMRSIRAAELNGGAPFDAAVCLCDSINYMLEKDDLERAVSSMAGLLADDGLLFLDIHTPYYYRDVLGDEIYADEEEEASFIWENSYDEEERINRCRLTLFIGEEVGGSLCRKYTEHHIQRAYMPEDIDAAAGKAGLTLVRVLDMDSLAAPSGESERILLVYGRRR